MESLSKQASNFIKLLLEFGEFYTTDKRTGFIISPDGKDVLVNINGKGTPMLIQSENMPPGAYAILNPFTEPIGTATERLWFLQSRSAILGSITRQLFIEMANTAVNDDKANLKKLDFIRTHLKTMDEKFVKELSKIKPDKLLRIFYSKKERTAQLHTDMYNADYLESLGIRSKSVDTIQRLLDQVFGTVWKDKAKALEAVFKYTSPTENVGFQEIDCYISLMIQFAEALEVPVKLFLDIDFNIDELKTHHKELAKYKKVLGWCSTTVTQKEAIAAKPAELPPWHQQATPPPGGSLFPEFAKPAFAQASNIPGNGTPAAYALPKGPMKSTLFDPQQSGFSQPAYGGGFSQPAAYGGGFSQQPYQQPGYGQPMMQQPSYGQPGVVRQPYDLANTQSSSHRLPPPLNRPRFR